MSDEAREAQVRYDVTDVTPVVKETICRWFLLCTNPATVRVPHPILDYVPACASCAKRAAGEGIEED